MLAAWVEQFGSTVSPLLFRRTAECLFETLGRNLDDAQALLKSREFGDRLSLNGLKARTKPAGGTFLSRDGRICATATAVEDGDEAS